MPGCEIYLDAMSFLHDTLSLADLHPHETLWGGYAAIVNAAGKVDRTITDNRLYHSV